MKWLGMGLFGPMGLFPFEIQRYLKDKKQVLNAARVLA